MYVNYMLIYVYFYFYMYVFIMFIFIYDYLCLNWFGIYGKVLWVF